MGPIRLATGAAVALAVVLSLCEPLQAGQIPGIVARVDVVSDRIQVVQTGGREYTFACRPRTSVTLNGEPLTFEMLRAGWRVVIHFDDRTGEVARIQAFR
jgi:hypothetical protein